LKLATDSFTTNSSLATCGALLLAAFEAQCIPTKSIILSIEGTKAFLQNGEKSEPSPE
jgi:hypothetical protein